MAKNQFGAYLKALRLSRGFGLREFAELIDEQPANLSAVEHGRRKPWFLAEKLKAVASALGLTEGSTEWDHFFTLAKRPGKTRPDLEEYAATDIFPVLCRTVNNAQLTEQEIKNLVHFIQTQRRVSTDDAS